MRPALIPLFFILLHLQTFGDAAPKFSNNFQLYFYENGNRTTEFDSIVAFVEKDNGVIDTAAIKHTTAQYWNGTTLRKANGKYYMKSYQHMHSFVVQVYKDTSIYTSEKINVYGNNYLFEFDLKNNALTERTNIFRVHWIDYILSFLITLILEFLALYILVRKWKIPQDSVKPVYTVILINLITHPALWYIHANCNINIWLLELAAILIEAKLLQLFSGLYFSRALKASILLNILSWWLGTLITFVILINMNLL